MNIAYIYRIDPNSVIFSVSTELPQTTLTLEPPFPEIFTGETVTLSYTITAAAVSDQGQYCCRGQRGDQPLYSQLSDKVTVTVSEGHPQAVLTLQPAWAQIFPGETVTLSCEVEGGSAGWRFKQYRDGREEAGCSDQYSSRYGDSCTISTAWHHHSGVYWCESASGQDRSNAVNLTVSNRRVFLQTPPQPVIEGDTLTLRCHVYHYTATRVVFYKDNEELQSRAGIELSVDSVSKSDEGFYKCRAEWWNSSTYSGVSAQVRVSVRERPQAVLTQEPAWTQIYESERVTLRCQVQGGYTDWRFTWYKAGRNAPGTQLQYRYSKDNGTVRGAGSQDQHSIPAAGLRDTGRYQCEVEAAGTGLKKRSASVSLTVRASWHSAAAAAGFSVGFFVILLIVFTLLLLYHKIRGETPPGVSHYCHRERSDQNQDQAAGGVELCSQAQQPGELLTHRGDTNTLFTHNNNSEARNRHSFLKLHETNTEDNIFFLNVPPDSEDIVYSEIDTSKHNNTKKGCISQANPQQIMQRPCMPQSSQRRKGSK
ncbi:high affinity immunoglobulin gamma Fc receptor I-like [Huso huso]